MTPEELLLKEFKEAREKGDLKEARDLCTRLLKMDRANTYYWLQLSTVVETKKERAFCLKEVLNLEPDNLIAIRGLRLMGEDYEDPEPPINFYQVKTNWQEALRTKSKKSPEVVKAKKKLTAYIIIGVLTCAAIAGGILLALQPKYLMDTSPILRWTITPSPTITQTSIPMTPTVQNLNELSAELDFTFTPTPIYVATPHNRTEAYAAGLKAFQNQQWSQAVEYFNQVINFESESADIYYLLGECYRFQNMDGEAEYSYEKSVGINESFAPAHLGQGYLLIKKDPPKLEEASEAFIRAYELDPNLNEALLALANISLEMKDPESALNWLSKLPSSAPSSAPFEYTRAKAFYQQAKYEKALSAVEMANALDRSNIPVYKLWAQIKQASGDSAQSIPILLTYQKYAGSDPETNRLLAKAYTEINEMERALEVINAAIASDSKDINALIMRGDIYMMQNEIDLAEKDYDSALRINYYSFGATLGKGRTQLAATLAGSAYNYFLRAEDYAESESEKAAALFWRATALSGLGELNASARDFEAYLALPANMTSGSLRSTALVEYQSIITKTPTFTQTPTSTLTITGQPSNSATPTLTPTR